jgi:hypothetical protein
MAICLLSPNARGLGKIWGNNNKGIMINPYIPKGIRMRLKHSSVQTFIG